MRVLVSLTVPSMRHLAHRKTEMGSRVPVRTVRSLRTALAVRENRERHMKFRIDSFLDGADQTDDLRINAEYTLRQLQQRGVTVAVLVQPTSDPWADLTLTRVHVPKTEWTDNDMNVWIEAVKDGVEDPLPTTVAVKIGVPS